MNSNTQYKETSEMSDSPSDYIKQASKQKMACKQWTNNIRIQRNAKRNWSIE